MITARPGLTWLLTPPKVSAAGASGSPRPGTGRLPPSNSSLPLSVIGGLVDPDPPLPRGCSRQMPTLANSLSSGPELLSRTRALADAQPPWGGLTQQLLWVEAGGAVPALSPLTPSRWVQNPVTACST